MNLEASSSQLDSFEVVELDFTSEATVEESISPIDEDIDLSDSLDFSSLDLHHLHDSEHIHDLEHLHDLEHIHDLDHLHDSEHQHLHDLDHSHEEVLFENFDFFSTTGSKWSQPGGLGSPVNITYSFNDFGNFNGISAEEARASLVEGFNLWSSVAPLNFTEVENSADSQIIISQDSIDGSGGTLAFAFFPSNGDITFDADENWTPATFLETAVHEIGHSLGLGHEEEAQAILNPSIQNRFSGLGGSFLLQDDIEGIQSLYGSGIGSVNVLGGDFSESESVATAINGTEGDDTLIGNNEANQIVGLGGDDYLQGSFGIDSINGNEGVDTVSYDYSSSGFTWDMNTDTLIFGNGATETIRNVENVVGSQGDDRITVNGDDNTISGGGGADTFVFGSLDGSVDVITDYSFAEGDRIEVVSSGFGVGEIDYDVNSGGLFYQEQQFAILENAPDVDDVSSGFIIT
ncbi:MAG: matrixin family metalloprotease [Cyanobacteria bacterium P01_G01_bin.39]